MYIMERLQDSIVKKEVNTTVPLLIPDEDRKRRSDMGNKMAQTYTTTAAKKRKETKKEKLLADADVRRWYTNIARGSPLTAEVRLRRISSFCETNDITPAKLARLGLRNLKKATDLIEDHVSWMEQKRYSPGYIDTTLTAVKSWLRHFDVDIRRKIKVRYSDATPTLEGERVPNKMEIIEVFNRASLRTAAMIALVSKAGTRLQVLGNHDATDGLTLADMPDVTIQDFTATCQRHPCMIRIRKTLSKTRHQYFTFLTENGVQKILAYLNDRIARGEKIGPDSAVISPDARAYRSTNTGKNFLSTAKISNEIGRAHV